MSTYALYFSPTGGTKKVIDILAEELGCEKWIDLLPPDQDYRRLHFAREDVCLIGVPSFGGRVPKVVLKRLKEMSANETKTILVTTYGNRAYDDTLLEMKNELLNQGFRPIAAIAAVTEHSIMRQYGTGRPDETDRLQLASFANQVKEALERGIFIKELKVPGKKPYREYNGISLKPKAGKECDGCAICAKECPVRAISPENPRETDADLCISCMRCMSVCLKGARSLNKMLLMASAKKLKTACALRKENELFL